MTQSLPWYTIISVIILALCPLVDIILKTHVYKIKKFWLFMVIVILYQTIFDWYLTALPIYVVNEKYTIGWYITTIPIENYIFGLAMIYLLVIVYEITYTRLTSKDIP